jgi:dTDP-4-amino-4,6-dideoxygalactose transaminase
MSAPTKIVVPFVDLRAQDAPIRAEIDAAIRAVIEESAFIGGERVEAFERDFARAHDAAHCVSVANGTDAIYIVLKALGIGAGDEVITAANSWISSSETVTQAGATPVFVDIDEYGHLDADLLESKISPKTKAILPVHLYGQAADMGRIAELARRRGVILLEDCAQAHFATLEGRKVGTFGRAATFSFYPAKNLGAYGDAGAILTSDAELARKMRLYANHGARRKHEHEVEGINSRLDGLQAAVLSAKLPRVAEWNRRRAQAAERYGRKLAGLKGLRTPRVRPGAEHIYHLYVVRSAKRDALQAHLVSRGIQTAIHYPTALPFMKAYARFGFKPSDFPMAHAAQGEILSLPMFPDLTDAQIDLVAAAVAEIHPA